jgi:two-component system NtrC family response regulator
MASTLLIVEDDEGLQSQLRWHFDEYDVVLAGCRKTAIDAVRRHEPLVVLQDLGLPPDADGVEEGFASLCEILALAPATKVIVVTGHHETGNAMRAIAMGAYDFCEKPVDTATLDQVVKRAFHIYGLEEQNRRLQRALRAPLDGMIASDPAMLSICDTLERVAPTDVTCLILGESGTGKEVLSRAIHRLSPRCENPFVAINCAAVPENLIESELFGYERGAFTGATKRTLGKVEQANSGTLFLDEIGDMPLSLQSKMLRFLQEREIERLGGSQSIAVDISVVFATNKNVEAMVAEGSFREDLYYRISEIVISIPPLRDRQGDLVILARHLLHKFSAEHGKHAVIFHPDAISAMESYEWPGNIREMENKVRRAVIMASGKTISAEDLGLAEGDGTPLNLKQIRVEAERAAIDKALALCDGNYSAAAKLLGVSRPTLYDLIKKHQIAKD